MTAPDPLALAARLGVISYLAGKLATAKRDVLAPQAVDAFPPGSRIPVMIAGKHAGWLSVPHPRTTASVTSEAKFLAWVQEQHPTEIVTEPRVRESFTAAVLKAVKERGGWLNKTTGEMEPVPGVEAGTGDPYARVEPSGDAGEIIAAAWRDGLIDLGEMLALPAGEDQ